VSNASSDLASKAVRTRSVGRRADQGGPRIGWCWDSRQKCRPRWKVPTRISRRRQGANPCGLTPEGTAHVSPDGALRVITSQEGDTWESLALVESSDYDLRDAKLTVTPNDELMLNGAGMIADADIRYYSMTWFSLDAGKTWDKGRQIGDPGFWLWRTQWNKDMAYSFGYSTERDRTQRKLRLYRSTDGRQFETHVRQLTAPAGCCEDRILFLKDGSALCLLRHETGDKMAQLGTSKPPY